MPSEDSVRIPVQVSTSARYCEAAARTDCGLRPFPPSMTTEQGFGILHAILGVSSEAGELVDAMKKHMIYGKPLDLVNLSEEVGDVMWYLALLCKHCGVSFEQVWAANIAKLAKRYPEKFSEDAALNRDIGAERQILDANLGPGGAP